tara:strand:+ start:254 stop:535 length:282 start_codon:yes stop_codon:yes gene_type:complete
MTDTPVKIIKNGIEHNATAEEIAWMEGVAANASSRLADSIRLERDIKLAATDWRASSDLTLSTEWATYRQSLRDITEQPGFPGTITWPTEPEV